MATPNNQFRLRLYPSTSYNFIVDWGDGTSDVFNQTTPTYQGATGNSSTWSAQVPSISASWPGITHTYATAGKYTIKISEITSGGFPGLQYAGVDDAYSQNWNPYEEFNNDAKKVTAVSQWGSIKWNPTKAMNNSFEGCINLKDVVTDGGTSTLSGLNSLDQAWYGCSTLSSFGTIDTSNVIDFDNAWNNCISLKTFPEINTVKGTSFSFAWNNCNSLTSFPEISTGNGNFFNYAWYNCSSLKSFPRLNMSKANDIRYTWSNCSALTSFPPIEFSGGPYIGAYNAAADGEDIWRNCSSLKNFPNIRSLSGIKYFVRTWMGCTGLTGFEYTNFLNTIFLENTWNGCTGFTQFPYISCDNVQGFQGTWSGCSNLTNFPSISTLSATTFAGTWSECTSLTAFPLLNTQNVTNFDSTWYACKGLSSVRFDLFNFSKMSNGNNCFRGIKLLSDTYNNILTSLSTFNTNSNVTFNAGYSLYDPKSQNSINYLKNKNWTIYDNGSTVPKFSSSDSLIITVNTSLITNTGDSNRSITLPFNANYGGKDGWDGCAVWIDWGDGSLEYFDQTISGQPTHVYSVAGVYDIAITQNRPYGITSMSYWNLGADRTKIINIKQFGNSIRFRDLGLGFINASNLRMDVVDPQNSFFITSETTGWLYQTWASWNGNFAMTSFPPLNLSGIGSMRETWSNCQALRTFGAINCSNCTEFKYAWNNCISLTSFPLIDTSKGTNFSHTWRFCYSLSATDFPTLNMSKMLSGTSCFQGVKLTTTSYSSLLTSLCATNFNLNVQFHGGLSNFNQAGKDARDYLVTIRGWTIGGTGVLEI